MTGATVGKRRGFERTAGSGNVVRQAIRPSGHQAIKEIGSGAAWTMASSCTARVSAM